MRRAFPVIYARDVTRTVEFYEGLLGYNEKGELVPGVAERWEPSADQRIWTFHLRPAKNRAQPQPNHVNPA